MNIRRILATIFTILLLAPAHVSAAERDSIIVSLLTCSPGPEVYELCGHEAIRVRSDSIDMVWNYGTFDFNQPNFVYRFVKGETDYMLSAYPFEYFLPEYRAQQRHVVEQDLNLTQDEAHRLLQRLWEEAQPQNRTYRYNYVKDNCATRILDRLDESVDSKITYPGTTSYGTFRNEMRAFHRDYPWYQFGIDLALGSGLDYPLTGREEMFVPVEMMRKVADARMADGRPLVRETRVLNDGIPDATAGPTPTLLTPLVVFWAVFVIMLIACAVMWGKSRIWRWVYCLWFGALGLTGCVIAFLVFVSEHEATSPNLLLTWINPLQLIIAICVWFRRSSVCRAATTAMAYVNIIVLVMLSIVWPTQSQSANPAFFPMMATTLLLSLAYAIITQKKGYNMNRGVASKRKRTSARTGTPKRNSTNARKRKK